MELRLPKDLTDAVETALEAWKREDGSKRLWAKDASLWTGTDEASWLGWMDVVAHSKSELPKLQQLAKEVREEKFTHVLLCGMGGSSLAPEVFAKTFGHQEGWPYLLVLDSTDPQQVRATEKRIDIEHTLFIVSSKSGSTLEPNIFFQYFHERVRERLGDATGRRFVAVTDPGSKLERLAGEKGFRQLFHGVKSIGGRYSALSNFGLVPAAAMGLDVGKLLDRAQKMVDACGASHGGRDNPGVLLGTVLGQAAKQGRDKVTLLAGPAFWDLGAWLEQLLAESTGKQGKGLIPVDREPLGPPEVYGQDRVFVQLHASANAAASRDQDVEALIAAGQPVVRISLDEPDSIVEELFRWEIATAVAGASIGIDAFNQPDVEAAKVEARKLTETYEKKGKLPDEAPILEERGLKLYADPRNAEALKKAVGDKGDLTSYLRAHLDRLGAGDYFALLAFVQMNESHERVLQVIRHRIRDEKKVATCLGFGPRFLHSTGQAYKGGPASGVFLQVTCDDAEHLPVPQQRYTFGVVKAAQARGDLQVLADRGRRALRVHLPMDVEKGLKTLEEVLTGI